MNFDELIWVWGMRWQKNAEGSRGVFPNDTPAAWHKHCKELEQAR